MTGRVSVGRYTVFDYNFAAHCLAWSNHGIAKGNKALKHWQDLRHFYTRKELEQRQEKDLAEIERMFMWARFYDAISGDST